MAAIAPRTAEASQGTHFRESEAQDGEQPTNRCRPWVSDVSAGTVIADVWPDEDSEIEDGEVRGPVPLAAALTILAERNSREGRPRGGDE